jgi:hypothetical protein
MAEVIEEHEITARDDLLCFECQKGIKNGTRCIEIRYKTEDPYEFWVHKRCLRHWEHSENFIPLESREEGQRIIELMGNISKDEKREKLRKKLEQLSVEKRLLTLQINQFKSALESLESLS